MTKKVKATTRKIKPPVVAPVSNPGESDIQKTVNILKNFRLNSRETAENWSTRIQAEIATLVDELEHHPLPVNKKKLQEYQKLVKKIPTVILKLKLKPEKGRLRDIKDIHETIKQIHQICENLVDR